MRACLDLDGVLADFIGGALKKHKASNPYLYTRNLGQWDVVKLLGIPPDDFWKPLGYIFWSTLEWTPDGPEILSAVEATFDDVCLLSSPCDTVGCLEGKKAWCKKYLPHLPLLIGSAKEFCASSDAVLIDDNPENIVKFYAHGGHAILVPRPWNYLYMHETLPYVLANLEKYEV